MASCDLDSYLDGLALQLKDCTYTVNGKKQHVRWTRDHLLWIICIASQQLKLDRGDLFLEDKKIKLSTGCYTTVCDQGCEFVKKPFRLEGQECEKITDASNSDAWANAFFAEPVCELDDDDEWKIDSIEIDIEDPCIIKINPPVPQDGKQRYLIARCSKDPSGDIENGSLPSGVCQHLHAFTQLVLAYAYGMDGMINVDGSQSQQYHANYIDLMKIHESRRLSLLDDRVIFGQLSKNLGD